MCQKSSKRQAWFCTTGLPSDVVVDVGDMTFHLHKIRSMLHITLPDFPGGSEAFEAAVKYCYAVKIELTPLNVAPLRCAGESVGDDGRIQ
ncbi:putative SKP1/BTB/POZ domain superfamily protein [Helianthus annuus]|uniref:SKP1/BTB/POZ domain superfamily protein n=1 Tax=Helianthus annuus TaxID=4232 RepID=A0A9K3JZ45_HELAN|nr:putative SKP1/BTB/POZ domain superfamily protein [Helianthus annuus]